MGRVDIDGGGPGRDPDPAGDPRPVWLRVWHTVLFCVGVLRRPPRPVVPPAARTRGDGGYTTTARRPGCLAAHVCVHPDCRCPEVGGGRD